MQSDTGRIKYQVSLKPILDKNGMALTSQRLVSLKPILRIHARFTLNRYQVSRGITEVSRYRISPGGKVSVSRYPPLIKGGYLIPRYPPRETDGIPDTSGRKGGRNDAT